MNAEVLRKMNLKLEVIVQIIKPVSGAHART